MKPECFCRRQRSRKKNHCRCGWYRERSVVHRQIRLASGGAGVEVSRWRSFPGDKSVVGRIVVTGVGGVKTPREYVGATSRVVRKGRAEQTAFRVAAASLHPSSVEQISIEPRRRASPTPVDFSLESLICRPAGTEIRSRPSLGSETTTVGGGIKQLRRVTQQPSKPRRHFTAATTAAGRSN